MATHNPISDELRRAMEASGMFGYKLANRAGMPRSALHRFMVEQKGIGMASADAVARVLGLRFTIE